MPYLFHDTETTGLPDFRSPVGADFQPRVIQWAALLTDDEGEVLTQFCTLLRLPDGVKIDQKAFETHGISLERADRFGIASNSVLRLLERLAGMADAIVAHNIKFDDWMLEREKACNPDQVYSIPGKRLCTMEMATPICNLPPSERMKAAGMDKPKPPSLAEAYRIICGKEIQNAHNAFADVMACKEIFFAIKSQPRKD